MNSRAGAGWLFTYRVAASIPMTSDFSVKFYGCRGSIPVTGSGHTKYGGATSCLRVHAGGREVIVDAGSGLVQHSNSIVNDYAGNRTPVYSCILISHAHLDHLMGLPYFAPLYMSDATVDILGPRNPVHQSFDETIDTFMSPPYFPVPRYEMNADIRIRNVGESDRLYFIHGQRSPQSVRAEHPDHAGDVPHEDQIDLEVHCMRGYNHPKSGVNIYKFVAGDKTLVYATDTEGFVHGDQRLIEFAHGADILIHDAMYTDERYTSMPSPTQGYGHSTVEIATRLAENAEVDRLFLFHHAPASNDSELDRVAELGKSLFANTQVAADGLEVDI